MILAWLLLLTGLTISAVAIYYSVVGLAAIFSAALIPIIIMGTTLEVGKLVCASWLKANWERVPILMKTYMTTAVVVLMIITSMGIFGFLSKAHSDQSLVSGDVQSKLAIYDQKIQTAKENIDSDRKQLKQMDEAVDQVMARSKDERGATNANTIRRNQQRDRVALGKNIEANQKLIAELNDQAAPIRAEIRKVEAEVGPIKYIAAFVYGDNPDANLLEKAVTWVIIIIVSVFDPLAVIMLLAAQMSFGWRRELPVAEPKPEPNYEPDDGPLTEEQLDQIKQSAKAEPFYTPASSLWPFPSKTETPEPVKPADEEFKFLAEYKDIQQTDIQQYPVEQDYSSIEAANKQLEEEMRQAKVTVDTTEIKANEPKFQILPELDEESKKKELHDQTRGQSDSQDQGLKTYVQNEEQGEETLWSRIQTRPKLKLKDQLYVEYSKDQFTGILINEEAEPELYNFVEDCKANGARFYGYDEETIEYFARRIYELRKNQSNNTPG